MEEKEIKEKILSSFANLATSLGYSEVYGRIIGSLMININPMALEDVAKETGYSTSMVSLSLDFLETIGMIKRVKKPGDRKLYLMWNGDLLNSLKKALLMKIELNVSESISQYEEYKKEINNLKGQEKERLLKAIDTLEKQMKRLEKYVKTLSSISLP